MHNIILDNLDIIIYPSCEVLEEIKRDSLMTIVSYVTPPSDTGGGGTSQNREGEMGCLPATVSGLQEEFVVNMYR